MKTNAKEKNNLGGAPIGTKGNNLKYGVDSLKLDRAGELQSIKVTTEPVEALGLGTFLCLFLLV